MNKVKLSGRVCRVTRGAKDNGQPVTALLVSVANRTGKSDTFRVVCYGKLAGVAWEHAEDGVEVDVTGRLQSRFVGTRSGGGYDVVEVVASGLHFGPPRAKGSP